MDTIEGVSRVIRTWLCTFLFDQLLHFGHGSEYISHSPSVCVFAFLGEFLVVDRVYLSYNVLLIG